MKKYIFLSIQQQMPGITFTKVFCNFSTTILDRIIFLLLSILQSSQNKSMSEQKSRKINSLNSTYLIATALNPWSVRLGPC